jgi:hypothetical protein
MLWTALNLLDLVALALLDSGISLSGSADQETLENAFGKAPDLHKTRLSQNILVKKVK